MADPVTMGVVGAVAGAALNRDDPLKGAMLGAMLGGGGGFLGAGGAAGGAAAEGAIGAAGGTTGGAMEGLVTPAMMPEFAPITGAQAFPVYESGYSQYLLNQPPVMGANGPNIYGFPIPDYDYSQIAAASADDASGSSFYDAIDHDAIARASMGGAEGVSGSSPYTSWKPNMAMMGQMGNLLRQPQTPRLQPPQGQPGKPNLVNYSGLLALLEPKLTERKRVSLL